MSLDTGPPPFALVPTSAEVSPTRLAQYESILYALKSGVVILEAVGDRVDDELKVIAINAQGMEFFDSPAGLSLDRFDDAAF